MKIAGGTMRSMASDQLSIKRLSGLTPYQEAWDMQRTVHAQVVDGTSPNTVLLLEHPPTYTAGRRTQPEDRPVDGSPVIDTDRGGRITWHGPGQLVGYPLIALADPIDVVRYVRALEHLIITVCDQFGVLTTRVDGRSGVWVLPASDSELPRKIGAIGVRVAQGVTMHGFSLNGDCDLSAYDAIVPCGLTDAGVTSLSQETGKRITVADLIELVDLQLRRVNLTGARTLES